MTSTACVVPAPVEDVADAAGSPGVYLEPDKVEPLPPPWADEVEMDPLVVQRFDVTRAVRTVPADRDVFYFWYYDHPREPTGIATTFALCQSDPFCLVEICSRANSNVEEHRLLLVVSDEDYAEKPPEHPYAFSDSAAYDVVEWPLRLRSPCPQ